MDIYSSEYNPVPWFIVQVASALAIWEFFLMLTLMSLWHIPISAGFLFLISTFWHHKSSSFILCVSCPSPRFSHLSKKLWFLFSEGSIRNQHLSANCALCYWGVITSRPCQLTARCVCVYWTVCTHPHMSSCSCCWHWSDPWPHGSVQFLSSLLCTCSYSWLPLSTTMYVIVWSLCTCISIWVIKPCGKWLCQSDCSAYVISFTCSLTDSTHFQIS